MITNDVFRCVSDPIRQSILELLTTSDLPVTELASHFEVSRPAISRHLRVLRAAGIVTERRAGRQRIYSLQPELLERAAEWLRHVAARRAAVSPARRPGTGGSPREPSVDDPSHAIEWRQW